MKEGMMDGRREEGREGKKRGEELENLEIVCDAMEKDDGRRRRRGEERNGMKEKVRKQ